MWNLSEIFENENECEKFAGDLRGECEKFASEFKGNLGNLSATEFKRAIEIYQNLNEKIAKIETYAYLTFAKNSKNGAILAKFDQICNEIVSNLLFFDLEFCDLDDAKRAEFRENCGEFGYYLELLEKAKKHNLSLKEEQILLKTSNVGAAAFSRLFDESLANVKFRFGNEYLSEEKLLALLSHKERKVRKKAALALSKGLEKNAHILTFIYNMIRANTRNKMELRGFKNPEDFRHLGNQIEKSSVDALITAVEENFDLVGDYYEKKREIMGLKKLYDYDRYAPMASDEEISYENAQKMVLEAFEKFSPEFAKIAKRAFNENWIDPFVSDGKIGGAFSHSGFKDLHPYIMLNFTGKIRDVFTLAHELGHTIHQYLAYSVGYLYQNTPLTTAETASVFCEMIAFEHIVSQNSEKQALLGNKLEDIFATLYRQIGFTTFERRIHGISGELSHEQISQIWMEESKKMFAGKLHLNDYYASWWSYIPHFIHSPFYCYAYGYAQLLVLAIYGLYKSGKCDDFVKLYTKFLASGGSKSPQELIATFGLDINSKTFWNLGISEIRKMVDAFINEF